MGAQLWHHLAPWHPDPGKALLALQSRFLAETYDLPSLIQEHLQSAREAVRLTEEEGDPYELLEFYRRQLTLVEKLSRRPVPAEPQAQIKLLRQLYANSGQGIGNVLDVKRVSARGGLHTARRLAADEVLRLCKTERPTLEQAEAVLHAFAVSLDRGESLCFPVHDAKTPATPAGWYFVGSTVD